MLTECFWVRVLIWVSAINGALVIVNYSLRWYLG
jgi:hypothetical protein